ncbi:hypothetical protein PGQ11_014103 [Apiospora arundinis]|uniref:Uncharacterized protein n=1 Tax=Apiospora arundinis TaxID=335852 RepID=A0ABR2HRD1_9PEZI
MLELRSAELEAAGYARSPLAETKPNQPTSFRFRTGGLAGEGQAGLLSCRIFPRGATAFGKAAR